jgi:hypothetical protein
MRTSKPSLSPRQIQWQQADARERKLKRRRERERLNYQAAKKKADGLADLPADEWMEQCGKKVLDNAGIVRGAIFRQPSAEYMIPGLTVEPRKPISMDAKVEKYEALRLGYLPAFLVLDGAWTDSSSESLLLA